MVIDSGVWLLLISFVGLLVGDAWLLPVVGVVQAVLRDMVFHARSLLR